MEGFLLINKPAGMTSHDVVNRVRSFTNEKRVGHAGTLDPFATGLLLIGVGRPATREMSKLVGLDKIYEADFVLGAKSDTDDRTGKITNQLEPSDPKLIALNQNIIEIALTKFTGTIEQIPPSYSAIKICGKKMYEAARSGTPLKANPRTVTIYSYSELSFKQLEKSILSLTIHCSSGTYIRSIARDLGNALKVGGYVHELHRKTIGPFSVKHAHTLEELAHRDAQQVIIPIQELLDRL